MGRLLAAEHDALEALELAFAKLETFLRKAAERTVSTLREGIGLLVDEFTPAECANSFETAGCEPE